MNNWNTVRRFSAALIFFIFPLCMIAPASSLGDGPPRVTIETTSPQKLDLVVGKSIIISSDKPIKRVSLGGEVTPEVANAIVLTPYQVYVTGKAPGVTNLTLWGADKGPTVIDLVVTPDVSRLKEVLHQNFPDEKDIRVTATHDSITLSGTVSSSSNLPQVMAIAEPYFPKKVINLLQVGGVHQVMLEVRVAEMSRSLLRRLGFNFNYIGNNGKNLGFSMLNRLSSLSSLTSSGETTTSFTQNINALFRFFGAGVTWTIFIDALKEEGLLKVLAEPTLITLSGKTANFLAGGEFPVPIPQPSGVGSTITIEYKPFGVGLNFTPTVLSNKKINMLVAPEVSELDFSNAISIQGFVVPALTTRRVATTIELADGQSFAIAGLLKDEVRETIDKFPVLGDIPVLGAVFRSSSFQKNETELIVIVTPHLVKPVDMAKQTLPTDQFIEPDDVEFYLFGNLEGEGPMKSIRPGSSSTGPGKRVGLEGEFGHIVPK